MKRHLSPMLHAPILLANLHLIQAFQPQLPNLLVRLPTKSNSKKNQVVFTNGSASVSCPKYLNKRFSKENADTEDDDRTGMDEAFKSLDALSSLDMNDLKDDIGVDKGNKSTTNLKADENILKDVSSSESSNSVDDQDKVKIYTEIVEELENEGEDGIYENIMGDLKDSPTSSSTKSVLADADGIGSIGQDENEETLTAVEISQDTDEFMKRALEEAMDEVKLKSSEDGKGDTKLPEGILDDAEMMKEINAIFDRANEKILDSIAEMKDEQAALTEESAKARKDALKSEEERLAEAQGSVSRLLGKVKEETLEVEKAMEDLQKAQEQLLDDPLMKAADLRSGGIVKTASLAGALLFSFRSFGELLLLTQPNGADHGMAAAIQAVIAVACAAYFFFV